MRITIHVEDTDGEALRYEVERRVRSERDQYPAEMNVKAMVNAAEPMPKAKPVAKKRRK